MFTKSIKIIFLEWTLEVLAISYTKVSDIFESIWKKFVVTSVASVDIFGAV